MDKHICHQESGENKSAVWKIRYDMETLVFYAPWLQAGVGLDSQYLRG